MCASSLQPVRGAARLNLPGSTAAGAVQLSAARQDAGRVGPITAGCANPPRAWLAATLRSATCGPTLHVDGAAVSAPDVLAGTLSLAGGSFEGCVGALCVALSGSAAVLVGGQPVADTGGMAAHEAGR